jgi:hypothetical protein
LTSQRDVLVGQPVGTGLLAAPRDPPEQRPMRDAAELQPGLQGDDRAGELALEGLSLMRLTRPRAKITPGVWMLTKRWTLGRKLANIRSLERGPGRDANRAAHEFIKALAQISDRLISQIFR